MREKLKVVKDKILKTKTKLLKAISLLLISKLIFISQSIYNLINKLINKIINIGDNNE